MNIFTKASTYILFFLSVTVLFGCAPEVGSEKWCEMMKEKPKGDWTGNEVTDFARHCLFK